MQTPTQKREWKILSPSTWPMNQKSEEPTGAIEGASIQIFDSVGRIDKSLLWLFELVSSLSVLLLAFGLITSQTNVQTHGEILSNNAWMQQAWAWTQNIAIDMSLLGAIIRACVYWLEKERMKALIYTLLSGMLLFTAAIVSNVEAVQQSIEHLSLSDAYGKVIFPVSVETLTAVRSLAIVLILVAHAVQYVSWYHAKYRSKKSAVVTPVGQQQTAVQQDATTGQTSDLTKMLEAMALMNQQMLAAVQQMSQQNQHALKSMTQQMLKETAEEVSHVTLRMVAETLTQFSATIALPNTTPMVALPQGQSNLSEDEEKQAGVGIQGGTLSQGIQSTLAEKSYKEEIEELLTQDPQMSDRDLAQRVGCSVRTANRWKTRLQPLVTISQEPLLDNQQDTATTHVTVDEQGSVAIGQEDTVTEALAEPVAV